MNLTKPGKFHHIQDLIDGQTATFYFHHSHWHAFPVMRRYRTPSVRICQKCIDSIAISSWGPPQSSGLIFAEDYFAPMQTGHNGRVTTGRNCWEHTRWADQHFCRDLIMAIMLINDNGTGRGGGGSGTLVWEIPCQKQDKDENSEDTRNT